MSDHAPIPDNNQYALILAGGSGTRFWPLSRNARPKQLLNLFGEATLLNQTISRLDGLVPKENILILTNALQVDAVREIASDLPPENIFAEPAKRDTAPAVALGVGLVAARNPDATMMVLPSDQLINDTAAYQSVMRDALTAASARGVVGIVDYEMADNPEVWARRAATDGLPLRVRAGVYPAHLAAAIARNLRTGDAVLGTGGLVTMGALKVITDGSLNTRTALCHDPYPGTQDRGFSAFTPAELEAVMRRATDAGIKCAIHAIGDLANEQALDAFAATGARGSIEHAQLLSPADLPRFAALGVTASDQPEHAIDHRDVAGTKWAGRPDRAFPMAALRDAGARIVLGSDAPVAPLDPWVAIAAATERTLDAREPWHPEQRLTRPEALVASIGADASGSPLTVILGAPADLAVTETDPLSCDAATLRAMPIAATMIGGRWSYRAL